MRIRIVIEPDLPFAHRLRSVDDVGRCFGIMFHFLPTMRKYSHFKCISNIEMP